MAKRRLEITFERERLLVVGRRRVSVTAWCEGCGARSVMFTPEGAAEPFGLTARAIYRRIEEGSVHFTEAADGTLFVCRNSLDETAGAQTLLPHRDPGRLRPDQRGLRPLPLRQLHDRHEPVRPDLLPARRGPDLDQPGCHQEDA